MDRLVNRRHIAALLAALALGACSRLADSDAVRTCRSLIPLFDTAASSIDVERTHVSPLTVEHEQVVKIEYRTRNTGALTPVRQITCIYDQQRASQPDANLGAAAAPVEVVTDDGAIGPLRLYLAARGWIGSGAAAAADPAPYATLGPLPELPRSLAIGLQDALGALPQMSVYAVLAAAYALVYGLTGRINLAFGELTVLAGYGAVLGVAAFDQWGGHPGSAAAIAVALIVGIAAGVFNGAALGRYVLLPLVGVSSQAVLIATVGMALVWSELLRLSQGPAFRWLPPLFNKTLALGRSGDFVVTTTPMTLLLPLVALSAAAALLLTLRRTRFGRRWRAFADDPAAAALFGVDPSRLVVATMVLAAGVASLAGVMTALFYGGVGFAGGQTVGLKALVGAVIGGLASVEGAMIGGLLLGLMEAVWSAAFTIESRDAAIYALLVLLLIFAPDGIAGRFLGGARTDNRSHPRY